METLPLDEIERRFGHGTDRRAGLYERLCEWLDVARSTGALRRVWIFGSFVSAKPYPGDLDVLALFATGFDPATLAPESQSWFDHELCAAVLEIDLFYMTGAMPRNTLDLTLATFGRDRSGQETMVEVSL